MKKYILFVLIISLVSCNISKEYYENGKIEKVGKTTNGLKNGKWKYYFSDGNFRGGGKYLNGKRTGQWKWFYQNGMLEQIGEYLNDEQEGEWKFYHDNGIQSGVGTLKNGKRIGVWKWFFNNGQIQTERYWNDGKLIKVISCYDGKGNELDKGSLINGNGTMKLYDIKGNLLETYIFENGEYVN